MASCGGCSTIRSSTSVATAPWRTRSAGPGSGHPAKQARVAHVQHRREQGELLAPVLAEDDVAPFVCPDEHQVPGGVRVGVIAVELQLVPR